MRPTPIGCGRKDAIAFMGCSQNLFEIYQRRGIIKPALRGWYRYESLLESARAIHDEDPEGEPEGGRALAGR